MLNKSLKLDFIYDEEHRQSICLATYHDHCFYGVAHCLDQDVDMLSERTGCEIARMKATIKYYKYLKNAELIPAYKAYKHLLNLYKQDPNYNEKLRENKILNKQIKLCEENLKEVNEAIEGISSALKIYIEGKEKIYQRIRA